jgi:hydroxymethylglutaryl-CoA reductase (NADPH)
MADDDGHRSGTGNGAGSGRNGERDNLILNKLRSGEIKLYELEKELEPMDAIRVRREYIEQETGTKMENIGIFSIDIERVVKRNCENMIGTVQVPLGVAGPVTIKGMRRAISGSRSQQRKVRSLPR